MKVKLLKKLHKRIFITQRNNEFKVIDTGGNSGFYLESKWINYEEAKKKRRKWILSYGEVHKTPKKYMKS